MLTVTPNDREFLNVGTGAGTANMRLKNDVLAASSIELTYKIGGTRATEAQMNTDILETDFKVSGVSQRLIPPAQIFSLERLKGQAVTNGRIPLRFAQPERRSAFGEDKTLLFPHLNGEISIDVKLAANATARTLEASIVGRKLTRAQYDAIKVQPNLITYQKQQVQVTTTGKKTHSIDMAHGRSISMFHAFSTDVTAMRVLLGDLVIYNFRDKTELDVLLEDAGYVPQANMWSFGGELLSGRVDDALAPSNRVLNIEFTMGAASSFDLLTEELGRFKS